MLERKKIIKQQQPQQSKLVPKKKVLPPVEDEEELTEEFEQEEEIEEVVRPVKKAVSARQPVPEVEEDEPEEESEEEVEELPVRKPKLPARTVTTKDALAEAFKNVPIGGANTSLRAGIYEAVLTMTMQYKPGTPSISVRYNARLCAEEFREYTPLAEWRVLVTKAGDPNPVGMRMFYEDLIKLGFTDLPDPPTTNELVEVLAEVTEKQPGALIKVYHREWQDVDQVRFNIQGPCDNDVIDQYKDNVPF